MSEDPQTDRADEMEAKLDTLGDHIDDAEKKLADRKDEANVGGNVTGEFDNEQDRGGGDDPVGAAEDAQQAEEARQQGDAQPDGTSRADEGDDDQVAEEVASPT